MFLIALNRMRKFGRWLVDPDKAIRGNPLRTLIVFVLLFAILMPVVLLIGNIVLTLPWLFTLLIIIAIAVAVACIVYGLRVKNMRCKALKIANNILTGIMLFLIWVFLFGLFVSFWRGEGGGVSKVVSSSNLRFPVSYPSDIAVDSHGHIYCAVYSYCRVQVYDKDGRFLRGWPAPIGPQKKNFRLVMDNNDNLHLIADYGHYTYKTNGQLLSDRKFKGKNGNNDFAEDGSILCKFRDGNTYSLKSKWLFPKIIKTTSNGEQSIIQLYSWSLWLMKGPWQAFGLLALLNLLWYRLNSIIKKTEKERPV